VTVFNKRNALVGFLTLKVVEQRLRRRRLRRKAPKIALFSLVGLASLGAVIGIVAVLLRRRGDDDIVEDVESEIVGEYDPSSSEPFPAT
jgi:NhaP-type Na+/H+ or K+/H+ antiporter